MNRKPVGAAMAMAALIAVLQAQENLSDFQGGNEFDGPIRESSENDDE